MWKDLKSYAANFFKAHRTRKIGFVIGLLLGICILLFGLFNTFFIFLCGFIGLYIGSQFDSSDELIDETLRKLNKILPDRFQRW